MNHIISMGIYTDGKVYGVSVYVIQDNGEIVVLFEYKYTIKMTTEQIAEIKKTYYDDLSVEERSIVRIKFYTSCTCTYDTSCANTTYTDWVPGNTDMLLALFRTGDIRL